MLHGLAAHPPRALELAVLVAASAAATVTRYVALRTWVFARRHAPHAPHHPRADHPSPEGRGGARKRGVWSLRVNSSPQVTTPGRYPHPARDHHLPRQPPLTFVRRTSCVDASADARTAARIEQLATRLTELRDAYYRGETLVADADYDALEDELRALLAEHPELTPDPNPLERVGAPTALHAPVRHSRPMLSLEKSTTPEQVAAFFDRFPGQPVVVMPKLDGLSLALVYERGRLAAGDHPRRRHDRRRRHAARARAGLGRPGHDRRARAASRCGASS